MGPWLNDIDIKYEMMMTMLAKRKSIRIASQWKLEGHLNSSQKKICAVLIFECHLDFKVNQFKNVSLRNGRTSANPMRVRAFVCVQSMAHQVGRTQKNRIQLKR